MLQVTLDPEVQDAISDAVETAAKNAEPVTLYVPILVSIVAAGIALWAASINYQASAPRLTITFLESDVPSPSSYRFRITNSGKTWVSDVQIRWFFDPLQMHHSEQTWSASELLPGDSFVATLDRLPGTVMHSPQMDLDNAFSMYDQEFGELASPKRKRGVATYRRQIRFPFVTSRQRLALPALDRNARLAFRDAAVEKHPDIEFDPA